MLQFFVQLCHILLFGNLAQLLLFQSCFSLSPCYTFALDNANASQQVCMNAGSTTSQGCITLATLHTRVTNSIALSINRLVNYNNMVPL